MRTWRDVMKSTSETHRGEVQAETQSDAASWKGRDQQASLQPTGSHPGGPNNVDPREQQRNTSHDPVCQISKPASNSSINNVGMLNLNEFLVETVEADLLRSPNR